MEAEETKAQIYETLAAINRAFQQIISSITTLQKSGVVSADLVQDYEIHTNDLWARINSHILTGVNRRETDDRDHYGKMRATLERRIRGRQ